MSLESWLSDRRAERETAGLVRRLCPRAADSTELDLAGNDYLGLATDPRVVEAATEAVRRWGAGALASRLVTGTTELHVELEQELARFTGLPAALVLSTGYHANLAAVTALCDRDTLVVSDAHIHASLVDACRLARHGGLFVVPHNDVDAVETALRERTQTRALVLCESIYSVLGDEAPLDELAHLIARYDAVLLIDEAHGLGVAGQDGRGLTHRDGLCERPDVVVTATLSKALGSQGGAVLASSAVVEHLVNTARPFIYDTGLAPAAAGAALEALKIISAEPARSRRVHDIAWQLAKAAGVERSAGSVLSMPMPGPREALAQQAALLSKGIRVGCFRPPSVPDGVSRLRITARASLSDTEVNLVAEELAAVAGSVGAVLDRGDA